MNNSKNHDVIAISLFSGCGGLDIGCELAGVPVVCCLDNDKDCIRTLRANKVFSKAKIYQANIASFPISAYERLANGRGSKKFIIIGGPPCQPFSKAGYWVGLSSRQGFHDSRNKIGEYLRVIYEMKPDGFLFENVESLLHPVNSMTVEIIISHILKMGYHYRMIRANALDYGVPQKRKRIFILASRRKFNSHEPQKTHCPPEDCNRTGLLPYEGVGKYIYRFDGPDYFEEKEVTSHGKYSKELREVPPGKNYLALTTRAGYPDPPFKAGTRYWSFLLKLHPELPSWTIAAQPGPWIGPFHWTSRRLRVPEIAAIQTFPDDYQFIGSRRSVQSQIGNAVPPLMGKAMIEFLKENL